MLVNEFTSTGSKLYHHQEVMQKLRDGKGMPIVTHVLCTDLCQATCSFCSVLTRKGDTLELWEIERYLDQLVPIGLRSVIISGGGNPILYKCKKTGAGFDDLINMIHGKGLEIGLITNGMKMKKYPDGRTSWLTTKPETLDKFTWIRISMAGLDHEEKEVYVPDVDKSKTTLGFSYVLHDTYHVDEEPNHGKVSTLYDLGKWKPKKVEYGSDRLPWIEEQIAKYVKLSSPSYVRLLPNCLEHDKISSRCEELQGMANRIDPNILFVQYKPPAAPNKCFLGYPHPVLNSDGYVFPCDSVVLNKSADHRFNESWRICHWTEIGEFYKRPVKSLIENPSKQCESCVFSKSNAILENVVNGAPTPPPDIIPVHPNFV